MEHRVLSTVRSTTELHPQLSLHVFKCTMSFSKPATISMVVQEADDVFLNKKKAKQSIHSFICFKDWWLYPKFQEFGTLEKGFPHPQRCIYMSATFMLFSLPAATWYFSLMPDILLDILWSMFLGTKPPPLQSFPHCLSWVPSILYIHSLLEHWPSFSIIQIRMSYIDGRIYKVNM